MLLHSCSLKSAFVRTGTYSLLIPARLCSSPIFARTYSIQLLLAGNVIALIKPKQVSVANLGGLKASQVVQQGSTRLGRKFTLNSHARCWKHFNTRPTGNSLTPEACDNRYCYFDVLYKDYVYTSAWVDFLVEKLRDAATYAVVVGGVTPTPAAVAAVAGNP